MPDITFAERIMRIDAEGKHWYPNVIQLLEAALEEAERDRQRVGRLKIELAELQARADAMTDELAAMKALDPKRIVDLYAGTP